MTTTTFCRAWSIRRADGLTLGFTDHDVTVRFGGLSYRPDHGMTARALVQGSGLSVDNSEAEGALSDDAITERDLLAGRWDNAELKMWEVDWSDPARRRLVFAGRLGEIARSRGAFRAELRGLSEPLNAAQGRVFHPRCSARLGDGACKVDLAGTALRIERQVLAIEDEVRLRLAEFPDHSGGWFERGTLLVLDGPAEGLGGAIKNDLAIAGAGREIELWQQLGTSLRAGDTVRLTAGCDKRAETCRMKFANFLNFRGFPHLPSEDWLMAPQAGGNRG
ncbi:DUF2163 domain-containing protein [Paracoccus spongiarum]|uniref:DUF2163 domain-containing protein n=1 Tax=Paracoccus spongiarum TaxID=3064387 RepID=A0ABT9J768_9RHOB|nr:DUF2163 domain-containing protein [Paracoccus sp. 2205BS29-5]MDP5305648.1 DUF2163 domain-containing protein [Paracoccus sp. 2205BS29-5]